MNLSIPALQDGCGDAGKEPDAAMEQIVCGSKCS